LPTPLVVPAITMAFISVCSLLYEAS